MITSRGVGDTSSSVLSHAAGWWAPVLQPACQKLCTSSAVTKRLCHSWCMSLPCHQAAQSALLQGSHKAVLAMPTEVRQVSTVIADFQQVELKPLGGLEGVTPNTAQGITPVRGQSPVPSPRTCHTAAIAAGGRLRIRGNSQAAPPPLPRGEDALRDLGVSAREGCASSRSKKRTLFPLSIFFFPSGLNPLLERGNSISRETGSLRLQGLSQLPVSFCHRVTWQQG